MDIMATVFLPDGYALEIGEWKYRARIGKRILAPAKKFVGPWPKFVAHALRLNPRRHDY